MDFPPCKGARSAKLAGTVTISKMPVVAKGPATRRRTQQPQNLAPPASGQLWIVQPRERLDHLSSLVASGRCDMARLDRVPQLRSHDRIDAAFSLQPYRLCCLTCALTDQEIKCRSELSTSTRLCHVDPHSETQHSNLESRFYSDRSPPKQGIISGLSVTQIRF